MESKQKKMLSVFQFNISILLGPYFSKVGYLLFSSSPKNRSRIFIEHSLYKQLYILLTLFINVKEEGTKDFGMRRSASERKLIKKKKDERKDKSRKIIK